MKIKKFLLNILNTITNIIKRTKKGKMITVKSWNKLSITEQEKYIKDNNIKISYTTNIADEIERGLEN
jgi:hypothetical protein